MSGGRGGDKVTRLEPRGDPCPYEEPRSPHSGRSQREDAVCEPGGGSSADGDPATAVTPDVPPADQGVRVADRPRRWHLSRRPMHTGQAPWRGQSFRWARGPAALGAAARGSCPAGQARTGQARTGQARSRLQGTPGPELGKGGRGAQGLTGEPGRPGAGPPQPGPSAKTPAAALRS